MFSHKGCQVILWIVGVLFIVGMLNNGTCGGLMRGGANPQGTELDPVVMVVGGQSVTASAIQDTEAKMRSQQSMPGGDPQVDFFVTARAIDQSIEQAALAILAKKKGIQVTDATVTALLKKQKAAFIESEKQRLIQSGKLKADAPEADVIKAFKEASGGKTPDEAHEAFIGQILTRMKDTQNEGQLIGQLQGALLSDQYQGTINATVDQLKDSYTNYKIKRLTFSDPQASTEGKKASAAKALAEIKGGMKFDDAIKKYDKTGSNAVIPIDKKRVETMEQLKFLMDLKPGQVSDVKDESGIVSIYQLIEVKVDLPPNFEKDKDRLLTDYKANLASDQIVKDVEAIKNGSEVQFKDDAFKLTYDMFKAQNDAAKVGPEKAAARFKELAEEAKALQPKTGVGARLKTLVRYVAFETVFTGLKPEEQNAARKERAEVLREVLDNTPAMRIRLDLYENYVAMGDFESAGEALLDAAKNDVGSDPASVASNSDLEGRVAKAEKDGKISKEIIAAVKKEIERWKQERIADEKQREADEKEQKEAAKQADEELKKLNDPEAVKKQAETTPPKK